MKPLTPIEGHEGRARSGILRRACSDILRTASAQLPARVKPITCKGCRQKKEPFQPGAKVCSPACGITFAALLRERAERAEAKRIAALLRAARDEARPLRWHLKTAEKAVNDYVRERDRFKPCCSCPRPAHWDGQWHASHFKSVGSNSVLRFHLWNIAKACYICNVELSGNIAQYRIRMEALHPSRASWLDTYRGAREYSKDYLIRLTALFRKKTRRLMARHKEHS